MVQEKNSHSAVASSLVGRVQMGGSSEGEKVLVYGQEGCGKTTFGKQAPDPFFMCLEQSGRRLPKHIPWVEPTDWQDALSLVRALRQDPMGRKSFVIDTVDWLESLSIHYICTRDNARYEGKLALHDGRVDFAAYGWGNGSKALVAEWRILLAELDALQRAHGMHIVLLAHVGSHRKKNDTGADYDQIGPQMDKLVTDRICQWPDTVLYVEFDRTVIQRAPIDRPDGKAKVVTDGTRVCWTQPRGAHRAKNRSGMPERIPFSWKEFARYATADVVVLRREVEEKLARLNDPVIVAKARRTIEEELGEAGVLIRASEWLDDLLGKATNGAGVVSAPSIQEGV